MKPIEFNHNSELPPEALKPYKPKHKRMTREELTLMTYLKHNNYSDDCIKAEIDKFKGCSKCQNIISSYPEWHQTSENNPCDGCHSLGSEYCAQSCDKDENYEKSIKSFGNNWDKLIEYVDKLLPTDECEHPYAFVYRKGDFEKCSKCGKILCNG